MGNRLELHEKFIKILGSSNVYFQPPENLKLKYPCIMYKRGKEYTIFADNKLYMDKKRYIVTVIDYDPDSIILDKIKNLPMCTHDTHYTSDGLNHDVYILYY